MIQLFKGKQRQVYDFFKLFAKKFGHKKELGHDPYLGFQQQKKPRIAWLFLVRKHIQSVPEYGSDSNTTRLN